MVQKIAQSYGLSVWLCWKGYKTQRIPKRSTAIKLHRVCACRITGVAGDCTEFGQAGLHRISGVSGWDVSVLGKIAQSLRLHRVSIWVFGE